MPKWKKGEIEFNVSVNDDGHTYRIPKQIIDRLGITDGIRFLIKDKNIIVSGLGER